MNHDIQPANLAASRISQPWLVVLVLFAITSFVEALGVSQIFAFMPLYLQQMGLPKADVPHWVGALSSLVFLLGLPLVPLWGVWADRYSRKVIIVRSALVEAVVFGLVALSRQPWQLAGSFLLAGFQLGNTGVMLAALREVSPRERLGTIIALFGAMSPVGFAAGPALGGFMIDRLHAPLSAVYALSALLSLGTASLLVFAWREVRPEVIPAGRIFNLAYGAIRGVFTDATTRRLFGIFGIAFLARQMSTPFIPLLVQRLQDDSTGLASAVALVVGTAALAGALVSPVAGAAGDRLGFRPVLAASLLGAGLALALMPLAPGVPGLALIAVLFSALSAAVSAMIFGLLAVGVPPERRSATLNLVYLPLYVAGIVGPAIGAVVVEAGLSAVFVLSGLVLVLGAAFVLFRAHFSENPLE